MQFILVSGCIEQFDNLRKDYEKERKVDLDITPPILGWPTLLGGTDVKTRRKQISFLEKVKNVLERFFHKEEAFNTPQEFQAHLMASRIMIAACLYVQNEIGSSKENSALYRLINKYLGITAENFLDEHDKQSCYQTAYQLIKTQDVLTHINQELRELNHQEFSKSEWELFSKFIQAEETKRTTPKPPPNYFPVSTLISPVFGEAFYHVGFTIGWVVAGAASGSSAAISPRLELTSWVSSALLFIGPTNIAGVALLAPTIAARLLSTFCNFSFSNISGKAGRCIGEGTAWMVGLPFDIVYNLLKISGTLIVHYTTQPPSLAPLSGICIANGTITVQGHPMQFNVVPQHVTAMPRLQISENGEITLDGETIKTSDLKENLVDAFKMLSENLAQNTQAPIIQELNHDTNADLEELHTLTP